MIFFSDERRDVTFISVAGELGNEFLEHASGEHLGEEVGYVGLGVAVEDAAEVGGAEFAYPEIANAHMAVALSEIRPVGHGNGGTVVFVDRDKPLRKSELCKYAGDPN